MKKIRRDSAFLRSQRIKKITTEMAKKITTGLRLRGLLIWIQIEIGLSENKAREYVDLICEAKGWKLNNGGISIDEALIPS